MPICHDKVEFDRITQFWKGRSKEFWTKFGFIPSNGYVRRFSKICNLSTNQKPLQPTWTYCNDTWHIFRTGPSKQYPIQVWSKLDQWFLRRRSKCEKVTNDGPQVMGKAQLSLRLGKIKNNKFHLLFFLAYESQRLWL